MKALFDVVQRMESSMTFHRNRHAILAGNVANVDTPGYKPFDLERATTAQAGGPSRTHEAHLVAASSRSDGAIVFRDTGASESADGNAVNVERELAKIDANRVRYATTSDLVSRRLAVLRYAAGDGIS